MLIQRTQKVAPLISGVNWRTQTMRKILVADIFGKTSSLEKLACAVGDHVEIIDPYSGDKLQFTDESEAYAYFMGKVGLDEYCEIIKEQFTSNSEQVEIISFSVGASAVWTLSEILDPSIFIKVVCFYGSQIRHHQNINPRVDVELVLPKSEPSFDVEIFSKNMSKKSRIKIHKTQYLHGFMNHHSENFNPVGYKKYIGWLRASTC
jgi:uncharacterized membrane protein YuzA (DUF378 family)